eukprot:9199468-Alexandrium_andersonii.AAC.1
MGMMWVLSLVGFVVLGSASCRMLRAALKTVCNAWLCAARFGRSAPCVFCGAPGSGRLQRVLCCPALADIVRDAAPGCPRQWGSEGWGAVSYTHLRAHETSAHL